MINNWNRCKSYNSHKNRFNQRQIKSYKKDNSNRHSRMKFNSKNRMINNKIRKIIRNRV